MRQNIVFGFTRPRSKFAPASWLIRLFQGGTPYSHVFVSWEVSELEFDCVFEAWGVDVSFRSPPGFVRRSEIVSAFSVQIKPETLLKIRRKAHLLQDTPYAFWENFGIGVARLFELIVGRPVKNPFGAGRRRIKCSELALDLLDDIQEIEFRHNLDLDLVDVKAIFTVLHDLSEREDGVVRRIWGFQPKW